MRKSSIALRVKELLLEQGFDRKQADALALVFDEIYHSQLENVATKDDIEEIRNDIKLLIDMIEKRFEAVDKRFEDINKRFEDTNKRFEDINKRFEDINKRFEEQLHYMDKRFEELLHYVDKRFEDLNRRITFTQWLIVLLFTAYTGIVSFVITYVLPHILK